jgi:hypothetical protein
MEVTSFVFAFFPYFFLVITQCADFYLGSSFFSVINVFGGDGFLHFVTYAANQGDPTVQNSSWEENVGNRRVITVAGCLHLSKFYEINTHLTVKQPRLCRFIPSVLIVVVASDRP